MCLPWDVSANDLANAITSIEPSLGGVSVTRSTSPGTDLWGLPATPAPNGYSWEVTFYGYEGDAPLLTVDTTTCTTPFTSKQDANVVRFRDYVANPMNCDSAGCADGVILRGDFSRFDIGDGSGCVSSSMPWNADTNTVKSFIESCEGDLRKVDVTRTVLDPYGSIQWDVTFTQNPGETPLGAGNVDALTVIQSGQTGPSPPQVTGIKAGSTSLGGTFSVDYLDPVMGSRPVSFDETSRRLEAKLNEMSTISNVMVIRENYPGDEMGGWGGVAVLDSTAGGYVWKVHFLSVYGDHSGRTFPDGTGNVDPIIVSNDDLLGAGASVTTVTNQDGSDQLSGTFTLSVLGESTNPLRYDSDGVTLGAELESIDGIGHVSVSHSLVVSKRVDGIVAYVDRDSDIATIAFDSSAPEGLRPHVSPGDIIRVGGDDDGPTLLESNVLVTHGHPIITTNDNSDVRSDVVAGETVQIGGTDYVLRRTGLEVQSVTAAAASGATFSLTLTHGGVTSTTACLAVTSTADNIEVALSSLESVGGAGNIKVTRIGSGTHGDPYQWTLYWLLKGDINQIIVTECVSPPADGVIYASTLVEGGAVSHERIEMTTESGYITGTYATLDYGAESTSCLPWGASAETVKDALQGLTSLSLKSISSFTFDTTGLDGTPQSSVPLTFGDYVNGAVFRGQNIVIDGCDDGGSSKAYKIISIAEDGTSVTFNEYISCDTTSGLAGAHVFMNNAIEVVRSGAGNGITEIQKVTIAATSPASPQPGQGFFALRLKLRESSTTWWTTNCIEYGATAEAVQVELDALDPSIVGHIVVTRLGDGSAKWGYGYEYTISFEGKLAESTIPVLGDIPEMQVIQPESCGDVGEILDALTVTASVAFGSKYVTMSNTVSQVLRPGDRVSIDSSLRFYTVSRVEDENVELVTDYGGSTNAAAPMNIVSGGLPLAAVNTVVNGRVAWAYDVYFVHPSISQADTLSLSACDQSLWEIVQGMHHFSDITTVSTGGSSQLSTVTLFSTLPYAGHGLEFGMFLLWEGTWEAMGVMDWDVSALAFASTLESIIGPNEATVSLDANSSGLKKSINILFDGSDVNGPISLGVAMSSSAGIDFQSTNSNSDARGSLEWSVDTLSSDDVFDAAVVQVKYTDIDEFTLSVTYWDFVALSTTQNSETLDSSTLYSSAPYAVSGLTSLGGTPLVHASLVNEPPASLSSLSIGDTWTLFVSVAGLPASLPDEYYSFVLESSFPAASSELWIDAPYGGPSGLENMWLVPQTFTVRSPGTMIQSITVKNQDSVWDNAATGTPSYRLTQGTVDVCVAWNTEDFEIEELFASSGVTDVTVTRRLDPIVAPNGYYYTLYFENGPDDAIIVDGSYDCGVGTSTFNEVGDQEVVISDVVSSGSSSGVPLTPTTLGLGDLVDSLTPKPYLGGDGTKPLNVYKVTGSQYAVTFESNIGDIPAISSSDAALGGSGANVLPFSPLVNGYLPSSYDIGSLYTGIPYGIRVAAETEVGIGRHSKSTAVAIPSGVPGIVQSLDVDVVLHDDEIQTVQLLSTYVPEVQSITTSAPRIVDVQLIEASSVNPFGLFFPEIQRLTVSSISSITGGEFSLSYTTFTPIGGIGGSLVQTTETTSCLNWDVTAEEVHLALANDITAIDTSDLNVIRSCDGTDACENGYIYDISFVGVGVRGNVQALSPVIGGSCATITTAGGHTTSLTVQDNSNMFVSVGTASAVQTVTIVASVPIALGSFTMSLAFAGGSQVTACINWDASALEVQLALEALNNVDSVFVQKTELTNDNEYGTEWTIYFDGHAMHLALVSNPTALS